MPEQVTAWRSRQLLVALVALVLLCAAIRAHLFRGYVGLDDAEYAQLAHQLAGGSFRAADYAGPPVFPLRVGLIAPTAALFRVFGVTEWTMVLFPFLLSLSSVVLIYVCARLWFGETAGLIAAALVTVFPWDIDCATKLLPDLPAAFFIAAGVTAIAIAERLEIRRPSALFGAGALAGVLFGYSWLCKESVAYLAPFSLVFMGITIARRGWSALYLWAGVAAGALPFLVGEMLIYRRVTGDLLFRLHETERSYRFNSKYFFAEGSDFGWEVGQSRAHAVVNRLFVSGPSTIFLNRSLLFLPALAVVASLYAWRQRDRAFLVPAAWFWTLVLMFNFSSSSAASYTPLTLLGRYLYPLFFPAILLVSGFLAKTTMARRDPETGGAPRPVFRLAGFAVALCLVVVGGKDLALAFRYPPTWWMKDVRAIRGTVRPDTVVYADTFSLRAFEFFDGYPAATSWTDFERVGSTAQLAPGSLVVVNRQFIDWLDKHGGIWGSRRTGYVRFAFYTDPPPTWTPVWENGNLFMYRVSPPRLDLASMSGPQS
jgi:Dolichyl-phosphate-mannose-protein mannosyltransferase